MKRSHTEDAADIASEPDDGLRPWMWHATLVPYPEHQRGEAISRITPVDRKRIDLDRLMHKIGDVITEAHDTSSDSRPFTKQRMISAMQRSRLAPSFFRNSMSLSQRAYASRDNDKLEGLRSQNDMSAVMSEGIWSTLDFIDKQLVHPSRAKSHIFRTNNLDVINRVLGDPIQSGFDRTFSVLGLNSLAFDANSLRPHLGIQQRYADPSNPGGSELQTGDEQLNRKAPALSGIINQQGSRWFIEGKQREKLVAFNPTGGVGGPRVDDNQKRLLISMPLVHVCVVGCDGPGPQKGWGFNHVDLFGAIYFCTQIFVFLYPSSKIRSPETAFARHTGTNPGDQFNFIYDDSVTEVTDLPMEASSKISHDIASWNQTQLLALTERLGDRTATLKAYEECKQRLADELNAKPKKDDLNAASLGDGASVIGMLASHMTRNPLHALGSASDIAKSRIDRIMRRVGMRK